MAGNITTWLSDLGLQKYAEAFAENDIDLEVLPNLSDADLKELGLSLGHRRKLQAALDAIGETAPVDAPALAPTPPEAERRQLTVMFCDLVGSTALSGQLDPEDYREVITSFQRAASDSVRRFDGHVAKYLGDGLLAYFGYPQAHEDDAERAVRSGLASLEAVGELAPRPGIRLEARVGIATGLVVAGDIADEGVSEEGAISGETPNLAARLQGVAEPGSVVIGERTRRLVGDLFECEDLGPQDLKGIGEPVPAYRVMAERTAASRFEARHLSGVTEFVGREMELQTLLHRWARAKDGEGQIVLISGEPGIGKSRLTERLHEQLSQEPLVRFLCQCSPHHTSSALYPIITQLTLAAGISPDDPAQVRLDKLEDMLAQATDDVDKHAPLLADLLSIPTEGRYPPLNLTPQAQKERTLDALNDHIIGLAAKQPVLVVFEDLHWIDPTTQELLDMLAERSESARVLALLTFRPEYEAPWVGQPHVTLMALSRLGRRESIELVRSVAADAQIEEEVLDQVAAKADGVPLFMEELTRTLMEGGTSGAIPTTIQASLLARFDRLGGAKEVAQIGAVIGRDFGYRLLAAASGLDEAPLHERLKALTDSQLVFARGTPPEATYTFKHALVQDTAYDSLLKSRRKALHARVAEVLEATSPNTVESQPELLAHHYTEAGQTAPAIEYWRKAGEQAAERSANEEAIIHARKGLALLEDLPDEAARLRAELALQTVLGNALLPARGYSAPETGDAFRRAYEVCLRLGDDRRMPEIHLGLHAYHDVRAEHQRSLELSTKEWARVKDSGDREATVAVLFLLGIDHMFLGDLQKSAEHFEHMLAKYEDGPLISTSRFGQEPGLCGASHYTWPLCILGYPDKAKTLVEGTLLRAHDLNHAQTLAYVLALGVQVHRYRGEHQLYLERAEELLALSNEQGMPGWAAVAEFFAAHARMVVEGNATGIERMRMALNELQRIQLLWSPIVLPLQAEILAEHGNASGALAVCDTALEIIERSEQRFNEAETHRVKGLIHLSQPSRDDRLAEVCFRRALAVARDHSARWQELRAAIDLARLWRDQGKTQEARDLLAPIYNWFTEGFDTADLKEAKALLEELG